MLDIKFVRENPEIVKQNIRNKFQDEKLPSGRRSDRAGREEPCRSKQEAR